MKQTNTGKRQAKLRKAQTKAGKGQTNTGKTYPDIGKLLDAPCQRQNNAGKCRKLGGIPLLHARVEKGIL